jgi:AraC-like DNA-binding protein
MAVATQPTISAAYIQHVLEAGKSRGIDYAPSLARAGIDLAGRASLITADEAVRFTQAIWDQTNDEVAGLGGTPVPRGTFRLITLSLIHAPDLAGALQRMMATVPVVMARASVNTRYSPERARIDIDLRGQRADQATRLVIELSFLLIHRFSAWLIGQRINPAALEFPYPESEGYPRTVYQAIYGAVPTFNCPTAALAFDPALLRAPIVQTEASLLDFLRQSPAGLFSEPAHQTELTITVRRLYERGLRKGMPDAAAIAATLSISEPHLRRLLRREGTSLNRIRQEVLCDAALMRLRRGEPVDHISRALGFSEPSAFRRAFKKWTGEPPGAFRP